MELKVNISDAEFTTFIKEATEAHLKTMARGTVEKYFKKIISEKVYNFDITNMISKEIDTKVHNSFVVGWGGTKSALLQKSEEILNTKLEKALETEVKKFVKEAKLDTLIKKTIDQKVDKIIAALSKV